MVAILIVCTGNVCRSPSAEGFLRRELDRRMGRDTPDIASAGTAGWEGSSATPESIRATAEQGVDISSHVARRLEMEHIHAADLIVGMAREHRDAVARMDPAVAPRSFTLKELVRLLEVGEQGGGVVDAAARAQERRRAGFGGNPMDEDVADPLGMPMETYRAMAWELEGWTTRLAEAIAGPVQARSSAAGSP
jgi:protein-tyrosine phosphatase